MGDGSPSETSNGQGEVASHGVCSRCVEELEIMPVENLLEYDRENYDELPFGIIEVDGDGRILTYNRWEEQMANRSRETTVGRLFFSEVAPCAGVAEFEGRFKGMVAENRVAREELDFVFKFPGESKLVNIILTWTPAWKRGFILVKA
jgi:photoactive yellow protein